MPKVRNNNFTPILILIFSSINVLVLAGDPFTPKSVLIRYWNKQISNGLPKPSFLIEKASPLSAVQSAAFSKLAGDQTALAGTLPSFCAAANLLCFPDLGPSLEKHSGDVNFKEYAERNFTNYGSGHLGGSDSFKNYSNDGNEALDSFRRYSRDSVGHGDKFATYAKNTNVPDQSFNTYGTKATGGNGDFTAYAQDVNVPNMRFTSYSDNVNGREQTFASYSENANAGDQTFTSYGKNGNGAVNGFKSYGNNSNVIGSSFSGYGENGNGANDSFINYGENGNVPENNFKGYGDNGNAAVDSFANYRDQSNVGDDNFKSYAKSSNGAVEKFNNYGNSFNEGTDTFSGYGGGTVTNQEFGFKGYGVNNTFKDYADKKRASFSTYAARATAAAAEMAAMKTKSPASGKRVNKWIEPGKFFRERLLKTGTTMPMPDIRDKMPKRSFLPRVILSKLPFSSSKIRDLQKIFHAEDNSSMASLIADSLTECERKPSAGESKRCVGSVEDMIDFATSVLGRDVVVQTTDNTNGSGKTVKIGSINKINGGKITKSVSCHQSLFPYLLYYCHSVPKVRVYEADLLDPSTGLKINHGVAICHIDTSAWSPTHGAFLSLGSEPGKIEVCHWIFENDMTWAVAD